MLDENRVREIVREEIARARREAEAGIPLPAVSVRVDDLRKWLRKFDERLARREDATAPARP